MAYGDYEDSECEKCGRLFTPKYNWQQMCWPCWFETPEGKAFKARQEAGGSGKQQQQQQRQYSQGNRYYDHGSTGSSARKGVTLDKDFLRKLLMLCHPDKHGGSELANKVTVELLRMKKDME